MLKWFDNCAEMAAGTVVIAAIAVGHKHLAIVKFINLLPLLLRDYWRWQDADPFPSPTSRRHDLDDLALSIWSL